MGLVFKCSVENSLNLEMGFLVTIIWTSRRDQRQVSQTFRKSETFSLRHKTFSLEKRELVHGF